MCRSAAEGGQRCAAHTRGKFNRNSRRLAAAKASGDPVRLAKAQEEWEQAAAEYASTHEGHTVMIDRSRTSNPDQAAMYQGLAARGARIREANKESATLIRAAEQAATTSLTAQPTGGDETITAIQFACEVHDRPGQCDEQCVELVSNMDPDPGIDYDPTGTSYPAPAERHIYTLDAQHHAVHRVTYTPNELIDYARHNGGPFEEDSGRCIDCDGHYSHSITCPTVRW